MMRTTTNAILSLTCAGVIALASCGGSDDFTGLAAPTSVAVTISDVSQAEGQADKTAFEFVVSLSESHPQAVTVTYATSDGTAQDQSGDGDYEAASGTLTISPNTLTGSFTVEVNGDTDYELDETFLVTLSNPQGTNVSIVDGEATGTITTDDFATSAEVEIHALTLEEGDSGQSTFEFPLTLSAPLANDVTVEFSTTPGTAEDESGDGDFQSGSGSLTFPAGHTELNLQVLVEGDTKVEPSEAFSVELFNVTGAGASILTAQATGTIENEDAAGIVVNDVAGLERDFGTFELVFNVALTAEHTQPVSVEYATNDGTASSSPFGGDFTATSGTLTFSPGTTELSVTVTGLGDFAVEGDEFFTIDLANETGTDVSLADAQGMGVVLDNDQDVRLDTDVVGGQSFRPSIASTGFNVYTAWHDDRDGNPDVYFNASDNAGSTWFTNDVRLDTDAAGSASSTGVEVSSEGPNVYVVWQDNRAGQWDVYFNRSTDNGQTWLLSDVRLDTDLGGGPSNSIQPHIASANGAVHVVWTDDRDGDQDVYYNSSTDGGTSWLPTELRLDLDEARAPGATESASPRIAANGNQVNVAWIEDGEIFTNSSTDGGATWLPLDVRADRDDGDFAHEAQDLQLTVEGTSVFVVWSDARNGERDIYFNVSTDSGASFPANEVRLDGSDVPGLNRSITPQISVSGGEVFVVWEDERNNPQLTSNGDIYFNHSANGGLIWDGERIVPAGTTPGKTESTQPMLVVDGNDVYVVWMDELNGRGTLDVFANVSFDGGASWLHDPVRLDSDPAGSADSTNPDVAFSNDRIFVTWEDARSSLDVFFRSLSFD